MDLFNKQYLMAFTASTRRSLHSSLLQPSREAGVVPDDGDALGVCIGLTEFVIMGYRYQARFW